MSHQRVFRHVAVDWDFLVRYNPPPGYVSARKESFLENINEINQGQADAYCLNEESSLTSGRFEEAFKSLTKNDHNKTQTTENENTVKVRPDKEDKVLTILLNILQDLEREIRIDKQRLKEERKRRQKERRIRRDLRLSSEMDAAKTTGGGGRHKFHRASQAPFPALLKGALSKSSSFCVNAPSRPKTDFSATLRKHESFNIVDVHAISDVSKSLRFSDDLNRGVAGKFSGHSTALSSSDWSRYSLYPDVEADFLDNKQGNDIEQSPCPFESKNVTSAHNVDTDPVTRSVIKYNDNKAPTKPVRKNLHTNTVVLGLHDPISKLEDNKVTGANDGSDNKYASHEIIKSKMKSDFEQDRQHEWTRKTENDPEVQESKAWRSHITGVAVVTVPHSPRLRHARVPGDDDVRDTTKRKHDQHVKVKLQSFDVLPNFKKNIRKKRAAGNVTGRNDDVLSDTSSVNTLDLDDTLSASSESLASSPLGHKRTQEDVHNDRKNELRGLNESKKYKSDSMIAQMDKRAKSLDEQPYESVNGTSENKSNIQQKAYTNQHEHFPVESNAGSKIGHAEAPIKPFQMRRQSSQPCLATPSLDDILRDPLATTGVHAHKINQTRSGNDSGEMRFQRSLDSSIYAKSRATGFNLDANVQKGSCGEALLPFVSGPLTDGDIQATDSEDDLISSASEADEILRRRKLNTYFLVLRRRASMALKGDKLNMTNGETSGESGRSFFQRVSMSDIAIPDHVGQLTDLSENRKIWGVILDMLFCVFDNKTAEKPRDIIVLPGCNIRPLVYKSAINGVHTHSQTVSGISKFQFVIDDCSSSRKHIFGVESQQELDTWYKVLQKAAALDPDVTNDISAANGRESPMLLSPRRLSLDDNIFNSGAGYHPTPTSPNREEKLRSPRSSEKLDVSGGSEEGVASLSNGQMPSPRGTPGLMRNDSRRQSVTDFKKKLRREYPETEVSKQQPIRAMHFDQNQKEDSPKAPQGKKLKSIGSFENLFKFGRKKRKSQSDDSISNDTASVASSVSADNHVNDDVSKSVDISASESKLGKNKSNGMSKSLEFAKTGNGVNNGLVRRASDIKDRVFSKRPSKSLPKLSDLPDPSMSGLLHNKHHLKWHKLWCVVQRGCFYGFKTQTPDERAQFAVLLANCAVVYVAEKDKRQKHLYIFKLTQERSKSIYLCTSNFAELMKWLEVLQMESNSIISNIDKIRRPSESESESVCSSLSSQSSSLMIAITRDTTSGGSSGARENADRSRSKKKKKAPPKPPRHSSCPPPISRDSGTSTAEETLTSGSSDLVHTQSIGYTSEDDLPRYDKAVTHVWQNDRGYLFNVIRAKMTSYGKRKSHDTIYNKDLPGSGNEGLLMVQDSGERKVSRIAQNVVL